MILVANSSFFKRHASIAPKKLNVDANKKMKNVPIKMTRHIANPRKKQNISVFNYFAL